MGNKLGRRRQVVDEKYTRPQGLYQHKDVDHKKLRKLILDSKLAPCYPGDEEGTTFDLEECPICFLHYPSLNRSRCCTKGICTECFLQMKPPHSTRPTQCPFCKTSNYAVEYRGARSKEEKGIEQVEEQRVIEAKIRMQQQEILDEEERMQVRQENNSSSHIMTQGEVGYRDIASSSLAVPSFSLPEEGGETINYQESFPATLVRPPSQFRRYNGEDQFDQDLEDLMVMEAIWLSIQENGTHRNLALGCAGPSDRFVAEDCSLSPTTVPLDEALSTSSARDCVGIDRPYLEEDSVCDAENASNFDVLAESDGIQIVGEERECYSPGHWVTASCESGRDWRVDHGSGMVEAVSSYGSSDAIANALGPHNGDAIQFQPNITAPVMPGSFEEQMMLASAVSLAEAQARTNSPPRVTWL